MRAKNLWSLLAPLAMTLALQGCKDKNNQDDKEVGNCADGLDNDNNGQTDCDDSACAADPACNTTPVELCDNGLDDDADGNADCFDTDCAQAANCNGESCDAPAPLVANNDATGDTSGAPDNQQGSCTGLGAGEDIYVLVPTADQVGQTFSLTLTSDADMGLYTRDTCDNATTELDCIDDNFGANATENILLTITDANPLFIFVDGFDVGEEGPYTLSAQIINLADQCNNAPSLEDQVPVSGDTSGAPDFFFGSCQFFGGAESIFAFNAAPEDIGKLLQLSLDSSADLALYARTDCVNDASELGCSDNVGNDDTEVLSLEITAAGAITIFVDAGFFGDEGPFTLTARVVDLQAICDAASGNLIGVGDTSGDTSGGAVDNFSGSCTGVGAPEDLLFFTPDPTEVGSTLRATLTSDADMGIYARSSCASSASELACADAVAGVARQEVIIVPLVDSNPIALFVDGFTAAESGPYNLLIEVLPPEDICDDQLDNDADGLLDCEDPGLCQGSAACIPGATPLGQGCTANTDCQATGEDPLCLSESLNGFPGGYCSEFCAVDADCGAGNLCLQLLDSTNGQCADGCDLANGNNDCNAGYTCLDVFFDGSPGACLPDCTDDSQCTTTGHCDLDPNSPNAGACTFVEDCTNGLDDDLDGLFDCEDTANDTDCTLDPTCQSNIANACSAASFIDPQAPTTDGDTSAFLSDLGFFTGSCVGSGTPQQIFSFTPAAGGTGLLTLTLSSDTDQGLYVRTDCADADTELGCADDVGANNSETLSVGVSDASLALSVFVEAAASSQEGPFTLTLTFIPDVCGDSAITGGELCDDGNANAADGCDANCQIETDFSCTGEPSVCVDLSAACSAAISANQGANPGDTSNGSNAFEGSCTGGGSLEQLFSFTPAASGNLTLTLASATDQGIYVRTSCADANTELDCTDAQFGGTNEVLTLSVIGGVPLTIFVDGFFDPAEAGPFTLTIQ